jgi:hypothetical protein
LIIPDNWEQKSVNTPQKYDTTFSVSIDDGAITQTKITMNKMFDGAVLFSLLGGANYLIVRNEIHYRLDELLDKWREHARTIVTAKELSKNA